jgi:hypothetical protein
MFDELLEIADDGTNDFVQRQRGDETVEVIDHDQIARSRLRVDTRKWMHLSEQAKTLLARSARPAVNR